MKRVVVTRLKAPSVINLLLRTSYGSVGKLAKCTSEPARLRPPLERVVLTREQ